MATVWSLPYQLRRQIKVNEGHWLWTGYIDRNGYARATYQGKTDRVHRIVFNIIYGRFPPNDTHHSCEIKHCVNPAHLKAKTRFEHKQEHLHTHCSEGHELTPENTWFDKSMNCRRCKICMYGKRKERRRKQQLQERDD